MHRLLLVLCAHVNGGSATPPPLPSLHLVRCRRSSALLPRTLHPSSAGLLLLLRPRRRKMPSCPPVTSQDDDHIQEVASQLTESTLKRALAHLITEAIDADVGPPQEDGVEAAARALVSRVLHDSWTTFLESCDLDEWLEEGEPGLTQRMASDLLHQVQSEDSGKGSGRRTGAGGRNDRLNPGSTRPPPTTPVNEQLPGVRAPHVDLDFFQSPREHTNTDTLYPKAGGCSGGATLTNGEEDGDRRRQLGAGQERGAAGGGDPGGEEIRFHFDNNDCRIDLRAVQPYSAVIGHSNSIDKEGNEVSVLLFDASQLPARSMSDYDHLMQQIFLYSLYVVEQRMYANYSIVYLHGNAPKDHWPRAKWLRQWCHALNSKTSKHLTQLFVVYPTLWIRTLRLISRPFVKFKPAVHFVSSLRSLINHLPEAELVIPKSVKESDTSL